MKAKEDISEKSLTKDRSMAMQAAPPARRTVWTAKQRIIRLLWGTVGKCLWICCPFARSTVLRVFGAKIGRGCLFARSVEIAVPWNLVVGDDCQIAEHVILYTLGKITLGSRVRVDTRAHLCAGSHDMRDTTFPLTRQPISIGDDSFIGVDAYISPNISLGANTIVHPRASVYKNYNGDVSLQGNPARPIE